MELVRLQKYLSDCGVLSRRAAEKAIENGEVTVNDEPAEIGMKIDPMKDKIRYKGRNIVKKRNSHYTYIMLHKPRGYVTTMSDEKDRKIVAELVKEAGVRVYPVGRLDMQSEGLLIMTNDGELTNALTHPRHEIPKYYEVRVEGQVSPETLQKLSSEMEIDGYKIRPVECTIVHEGKEGTTVGMILYEGRNRQIRKMCEQCELKVQRLVRIAIGDLELDIKRGQWRYLTREEVSYLKEAHGLIKTDKEGKK